MVDIDRALLNGIDGYFTHLSQFGQVGLDKQTSLLILLFIRQLTTGPMNVFITEEDYRILLQVISKLQENNCFVRPLVVGISRSIFDNLESNRFDPLQILEDASTLSLGEDSNVRFQIL